jgi:hypothetical protein
MSDDLTHIKDIGRVREKQLNEHGIDTYASLAKADPYWICEQMKVEGKPSIPLELVRCWIEEASGMVVAPSLAQANPSTEDASEAIVAETSPLESVETDPSQMQNTIPIAEEGWDEFASFCISYQKHPTLQTQVIYRTCADHMEANENQRWNGIEGNKLCDWIMSHVDTIMNDNRLEAALNTITAPITHSTKPSEIRIVSVRVYDSVGGLASATAGELFTGAVHSNQQLTFDFNLEYLASDSSSKEGELCDCQLSLYIYEMPNDTLVQKPQKIVRRLPESGQTYFPAIMTNFHLSTGLYRIRAVATLTNQTPVLSVVDIPLLQII